MGHINFYTRCEDGAILNFEKTSENGIDVYKLSADSFKDKKHLTITADEFKKNAGDDGFYLIPGDEKASGTALITFREHETDERISVDNPSLSFFAVGCPDAVYAVMIDNNYLYNLITQYNEGKYSVMLYVRAEAEIVEDDIVFRVISLPYGADYNDVAKAVRNYRLNKGEIRPLRDKCAEREALAYAQKYPLVRIRMGWKPVPPEVLHQTLENEPPMYVACTFADVRTLADKMKALGIDGAELSLVGWNAKGHDGRWPDIFPVEESLGGIEELRKTMAHVKSLGYKLTCHTNHADHYEIASTFCKDDLAVRFDGTYKTHGNWGGGMSYAACPTTQLKYAYRDVEQLCELGFYGIHYVDCLSICRPDTCFDPRHRVKLSESIKILRKIMSLYTERLGGFSSEGMRDFSVSELDFSLYNCFRSSRLSFLPTEYKMVDSVVPMMELIYHGILLYNVSSATVNAVIKGDEARSTLALLGGKPALYVNSKFLSAKKQLFAGMSNNWMGEEDLTSGSEAELEASARYIYEALLEYKEIADRQFVFMDSYKTYDGGLCVMRYEDGVEIAANFAKEISVYREKEILPGKYIVIR